ncbi:MAG TPA: hypothetical protein VFG30_13865 [Polyangiales bacterium]|jgi:hypothetical protein|nr:hypothetical protein [Polyangiales bacterium]
MELAFALVERAGLTVSLCLHTAELVPQNEWDAMIAQLFRLGADANFHPEHLRMLVISDGGAPDARQRGQLSEVWGGRTIKLAIVVPSTNNPVKQGVITALSWLNPAVGFFSAPLMLDALRHLDLAGELPSLWPELMSLQRGLAPILTLRLIAEQHGLRAAPDAS